MLRAKKKLPLQTDLHCADLRFAVMKGDVLPCLIISILLPLRQPFSQSHSAVIATTWYHDLIDSWFPFGKLILLGVSTKSKSSRGTHGNVSWFGVILTFFSQCATSKNPPATEPGGCLEILRSSTGMFSSKAVPGMAHRVLYKMAVFHLNRSVAEDVPAQGFQQRINQNLASKVFVATEFAPVESYAVL